MVVLVVVIVSVALAVVVVVNGLEEFPIDVGGEVLTDVNVNVLAGVINPLESPIPIP